MILTLCIYHNLEQAPSEFLFSPIKVLANCLHECLSTISELIISLTIVIDLMQHLQLPLDLFLYP